MNNCMCEAAYSQAGLLLLCVSIFCLSVKTELCYFSFLPFSWTLVYGLSTAKRVETPTSHDQ